MLRVLAILSLFPILLLAAPASALTPSRRPNLQDRRRRAEAHRRQAQDLPLALHGEADAKPKVTGKQPPSKVTRKQKLETCNFGADDQKLTGPERKTFLAKCMANAPRSKTATMKKPRRTSQCRSPRRRSRNKRATRVFARPANRV